jgi:hypothetical protein
MKCPECMAEGKTSTVTEGMTSTTLMYFPTRWDEHGNLMPTGRNTSTTDYSCSNGHHWKEHR